MKSTRFKLVLNSLMIVIIMLSAATISGCHRSYYRRQADTEVQRLVAEKTLDPRWNTIKGDIQIDSRSRMFDPFSKDHPPIPTDDPASHQFMQQVDDKPAYPHWHSNGDISEVENPLWKSYLPIDENGQVKLSLDRAYQLALIHSPDLQSQYETLYESALDVSLERFGFDSQLFAGFNSLFTTQGRLAPGGSISTLGGSLGANGEGIQLERMGITGANFVAGLANTILFNFASDDTQTATTLLDFSIVQPLLQNAGRSVILEALTQSERTLLANVRQLERFKRGFYLQVAIGRTPGAGPNLSGDFLATPGSGGANAGGFLGLLEQRQQIRNQEFNIQQLQAVLSQFREYYESGLLDAVQLKLFESNFYSQQRVLLDAKISYQTTLDEFKSLLGLPPNLEVVIEDDFLDGFNLISDEINDRLIGIGILRQDAGDLLSKLDAALKDFEDPEFEWPSDLNQQFADLLPAIEAAQQTLQAIRDKDFAQLNQDFDRLEKKREERTEYLESLSRDVAEGRIISNINRDVFEPGATSDPKKLRELLSKPAVPGGENTTLQLPSILTRLDLLEASLLETQGRLETFDELRATLQGKALYDYLVLNFQQAIPGQLSELNNISLDLSLLQAQARSNSIEIVNAEITSEHAIRIARCMRRDWMNARASLVDQYRNIEVVADQLEAGVDLVFSGSVANTGNNPFKIRTETGELQAGLQFDSPIVRLSERNDYRLALIDYQQAKRSFYQFEDSIKGDLRELVRNLGRNRVRFELDRRTVQVQIENVEINRLELDRPISDTNTSLGTTTARNLTEAIIGLNAAQNDYLSTWVQYEVFRRNLDFDMGTMQLDSRGQWIDPGPIDDQIGLRALAMMGIDPGCPFCLDIGKAYEETVQRRAEKSGLAEESENEEVLSPASETESGKLEVPSELETVPEDIYPDTPSTSDPVVPTEPISPPRPAIEPGPDLDPILPELSKPKVIAPAIEVPLSVQPAPIRKRIRKRSEPTSLPAVEPVSKVLPRAILGAIELRPIQPASLANSPPEIPDLSGDLIGLASVDLPDDLAEQGSGQPPSDQVSRIPDSFDAPQSGWLFHTLPSLHVADDSATKASVAEVKQRQAKQIATEKAVVESNESEKSRVPASTSFGEILDRFRVR